MGCTSSHNDAEAFGLLTKPHVFFLLGGPGSGKGTQAQFLIRDYKFKHLSTGDLLRDQVAKGGDLGKEIDAVMKEGKLLSSSHVVRLLESAINTFGNRRYLLDGFPRNQENWDEFQSKLSDKVVVRNLIYFECPQQILVDRMTQRSKTSGRADDNPETMKKRIATFQSQTIPIVTYFRSQNNCITVDATKNRDEVYTQLKEKLTEANVNPPKAAETFFVLGGPGSGKGTQCDILVKKYKFRHLSTGDLIRDEVATGSPLAKQLTAVMKEGKLVSSQLMVKLIKQKIESYNYSGRYLLDGFPRGQENLDQWEKQMSKNVDLKSVLYFECSEEQLKKRLIERGKTSGRADDNEESIVKRLQVFNDQTKPVIDFYGRLGKLQSINANRGVEQITKDVEHHLDSLGIFPSND